MKETSLADKLPFWHFDEDVLVYDDGSLGYGFSLQGKDISTAENSVINQFNLSLKNFLLNIKEGYKIKVLYRLVPYAEEIIGKHEKLMGNKSKPGQIIKDERIRFLRNNAKDGNFFIPEVFLFIKSNSHRYKRQGIFHSTKRFETLTEEEYEKHKRDFLKEIRKIKSSLEFMELCPERLSKDRWFGLLFQYFNLSRSERIGIPSLREDSDLFGETLADQLVLTDVGIEKECLKIGDYYFKFVSLYTLPEGFTHAGMINSFLKLPFHFWLSQTIIIHDQAKEIDKLKMQRKLANSLVQGADKMRDLESESKLSQIEDLLSELVEGSNRIVSCGLCVVVWDKDRDGVEEKADGVLIAFREMNQAEGVKEDYGGLGVFLENF